MVSLPIFPAIWILFWSTLEIFSGKHSPFTVACKVVPVGICTHEGTKIPALIQSKADTLQPQNCHTVVSDKTMAMYSTDACV